MGFIFIPESGNTHHDKEMSEISNWQVFQAPPSSISIKWRLLNMIVIPPRKTAASRPTFYLVLQPARLKLGPFAGGQVVKAKRSQSRNLPAE